MKKIAVFASGSGSDFQSVIDANERGHFCEISLLVASKEGIYAIERAKQHGIDHIVRSKKDFPSSEAMFEDIIAELKKRGVDYIVLAGYLSMITPNFVRAFPDRIINIHHSFLPAFVGAKPYHAAYERGVKLIGATSHYVTTELDAGPIIEQDVVRISHKDTVGNLLRKGQDLEKIVLSRAVEKHIDRKILVYKNKTIVFD